LALSAARLLCLGDTAPVFGPAPLILNYLISF